MKFNQILRLFTAVGASLILGESPADAATVSLRPVADTSLLESEPDNDLGNGTTVTAGGRRQGGRTRALFRFDLSSIPAGATVNSVTLGLRVVATPSGGPGSTFDLNRILAGWGEGDGSDRHGSPADAGEASWNARLGPATPWTTAGGDFFAAASASRSIGGNANYFFGSTPGLVSDVQGWLNSSAGNFGWLLRSESENTPTTIRRFGGREDQVNAPLLTIDFTPVPEPGPLALLGLGLVALVWAVRRPERQLGSHPSR